MAITPDDKPTSRSRYDWRVFREACLQNPGQWMKEDDPARPKTTGHQIRSGSPTLFVPGAFDAVLRKDGTYLQYLGVPVKPWEPWLGESFNDIERTFDPERFPAGTSEEFTNAAEVNTPEKAIKRERKRRERTARPNPNPGTEDAS